MINTEILKKQAAEKAVEEIKDGMVIGLGTGSTFHYALLKIAELFKSGILKNIVGIPSSQKTEILASELGIPLTTLNQNPIIDITIDGADEVTVISEHREGSIDLIKGGGGALLREKVLAQASKKLLIAVDESKVSNRLGNLFAVPVEVLQYCYKSEQNFIESLGAKTSLRKTENGKAYLTDENNLIIDAKFNGIENVSALAALLDNRAGIVGHGIFVGLASKVFVAKSDRVEVIE